MKHKTLIKSVAGLLVLLLLTGLFAGCGEKSPEETLASEDVTEETVPEEEIRDAKFGLAYVKGYGFNPYSCTCLTNRPIISLVFESLFIVNEDFQPEPVLCDKFGVSEDGLTYLISLRTDARFSDGSPVTAQDVVTSLKAASDSDYYGDRFRFVKSFSVFDDKTVKIELYTPYETFPLLLDVAICKSGTQNDAKPIGSGPFRMLATDLYMRRVLDWWQGTYSIIEGEYIKLQETEKPLDVRDSFEFGTTNLVLADPNSASSVGYRCDYELWNCNTTVMQYLGFNTIRGAFANRELRRALTWLIDRETVCSKLYNGFAVAASLPCSPHCGLYDTELASRYAYSPQDFAEWRKTSGLPAGTQAELVVWSSDYARVELANFIADALAPYGIEIRITAVDYEQYKDRLRNGNFDLFIGEVRLSNDFDLTQFFSGNGTLNFGAITDSAAYSLGLKTLANSGNSYDLYEEVMELGLICPVLFKAYAVMVTRGTLSSLQPAVDSVFHLPGGRTLADAATTYEEVESGIKPAATTPVPEKTTESAEPTTEPTEPTTAP